MNTGTSVTLLVDTPYFSDSNTSGTPDYILPAGTVGTVIKSSIVVQFTFNSNVQQIEVLNTPAIAGVLQDNS